LVPFIASVVTEFRSVPLDIDLAPLAFLVSGILWLSAILRGTLLDILPLARDVLVEQMSDGVVVVDGEDHVVDANPAALAMLHAPLAEVLGTSAAVVLAGVEGACALLGGSGPRHAVLTIGSDGVSRHVDLVIMPLNTGLGNPTARLVTLHDVTEERRVHAQAKLLAAIVTSSQDAMLTSDLDGIVRSWNAAAERLFGYCAQEMIGASLAVLMVAGSEDLPKQIIERVRGGAGERIPNFASRGKRKDGSEVDVSLVFSPVFDDAGAVAAVSAIVHDVTEMKEAEEKIRHNATHDALTGLPNRFLLDDRLEHALADARRLGSGLAVLFVDLDNFKRVNDTLGHAQGDALLAEVAKRIVPVLRESDTVGRVGGDEFTIIIAGVQDSAQVEFTARRLLEAIASPCRLGAEDLRVTASVGVALFPTDGMDATSLIQHADLAMYSAKELGRNRIQFFSEEFQEGLNRRRIVEKEFWGADTKRCATEETNLWPVLDRTSDS
jgi:diguanylate cyclase (GGDEF)-like protein/PAS domain S-box-containing protein